MCNFLTLKETKMPDGFLWGSGYAGYQVEGNNPTSNFYHYEMAGEMEELSGLACNSYAMYKDDINLVHSLGHQVFRTSIEWSRIEPVEGFFDEKAAEHYISFFSGLKEKGMKTVCTLVHFSIPQWFNEKKAFDDIANIKYFERYLEYIVPKISPYIDFWNVLNEFNCQGRNPIHKMNCLEYHARGYHIIKQYSNAPVTSAHAFIMYMPYRPNDPFDIAQAKMLDADTNEFFFHGIRTGEIVQPFTESRYSAELKGTSDYWSINMYTRSLINSRKYDYTQDRYMCNYMKMIDKDFYLEEFYPECIIANLTRITDLPIYITENGCCCDDDRFRIIYLARYLTAIKDAMALGADVRGYLYWSLMDNYEWGSFKPKFGLCEVNRTTFERKPKNSAYFYKEIIQNNGFDNSLIKKYLPDFPNLIHY